MFLDVGAYLKVAATVAVALLAFGVMASPAWAQDTTVSGDCGPVTANAQVGQEATIQCTFTNAGSVEAEGVIFEDGLSFDFQGDVQIAPNSFSVSATQGGCLFESIPVTSFYLVECSLGDLAPNAQAVVTIQFLPITPGTILYHSWVQADNAPQWLIPGAVIVSTTGEPGGGQPGGDNGARVLVEHNGKQLCLPIAAALHGHLKHGFEVVIDEEGCSNGAAAAKKNGKQEREGGGASGK